MSPKLSFYVDIPNDTDFNLFGLHAGNTGVGFGPPPFALASAAFDPSSNSVTFDVDSEDFEAWFLCGSSGDQFVVQVGGTISTFGDAFWVLNPTDVASEVPAGTLQVTPAAFEARILPSLPIAVGPLTIQGIQFGFDQGTIAVSGSGKAEGFDIGFTFNISISPGGCRALAALANQETDLIEMSVSNVKIFGNNSSFFGWMVNWIVDAAGFWGDLFSVFQAPIEEELQSQANAAISRLLGESSSQPPAGTGLSVTNVDISPSGVSLEVWATVPVNCPSEPSAKHAKVNKLGRIGLRSPLELLALRQIRDALLVDSAEGQAYLRLLRRSGARLAGIVAGNEDLLRQADEAAELLLRDFAGDPSAGALAPDTAEAVDDLMCSLARASGGELEATIQLLRSRMRDFIGRPPRDVIAEGARGALNGP